MLKDRFFLTLFFVLIAVALIHGIGTAFFLYWKFWWLDVVTHFAGGFWVGGIALWGLALLSNSLKEDIKNSPFITLLLAAFIAFTVGIWWEVYEVLIGAVSFPFADYIDDMILDLVMDVLGGIVAALCFLYVCSNKTIWIQN